MHDRAARCRARPERPRTASNTASWSRGVVVVCRVLGRSQVSPQALEVELLAPLDEPGEVDRVLGVAPTRCMPVSTFRCTGSAVVRPTSRTSLAAAADRFRGVQGRPHTLNPRDSRELPLTGGSARTSTGSLSCSRTATASPTSATPSQVAPPSTAASCGPCDAVAVAPPLDDGAQRRRSGLRGQQRCVVPDGAEIDLRPRVGPLVRSDLERLDHPASVLLADDDRAEHVVPGHDAKKSSITHDRQPRHIVFVHERGGALDRVIVLADDGAGRHHL